MLQVQVNWCDSLTGSGTLVSALTGESFQESSQNELNRGAGLYTHLAAGAALPHEVSSGWWQHNGRPVEWAVRGL